MELGTLSSYPLPQPIRKAFGAATAQELADQLGAQGTATPELGHQAESAYNAFRAGDRAPARSLLVDELGIAPDTADEALDRLASL